MCVLKKKRVLESSLIPIDLKAIRKVKDAAIKTLSIGSLSQLTFFILEISTFCAFEFKVKPAHFK